jgi:hypothetical protein
MQPVHIGREEDWRPKCPRCSWPYRNLGEKKPESHATNPNPNRKVVPVVPNPSMSLEDVTFLQDSLLAMKMAKFEDDFGMMASPEWYEEDIEKGNF